MRSLIAFSLFLLSSALFAEPVGSPASPSLLRNGIFFYPETNYSLRSGYQGNFTFDRRLMQTPRNSGRVDKFQLYANSGSITLNVVERLDLYSNLGFAQIEADWRVSLPTMLTRVVTESDGGFVWNIGTNIVLLQWAKTSLGVGGGYTACKVDMKSIAIDGTGQSASDGFYDYEEWQFASAISYQVSFLTPYIGVKYSSAECHITAPNAGSLASNGSASNDFNSKEHVGLYLGCSVTNGHYIMVNVEARLIDEEAVTASCDFRF